MESLKQLLKNLIQFRTTAENPEQLLAIIDYVEKFLNSPNLVIERYMRNGKPSLVVKFSKYAKSKHFKVIFAGHLDVVPARDEQFVPLEKDGKIFGRGALDMKGPSAVMIKLFKDLADMGEDKNIALMLTTDEEIGSYNGVRYLVEDKGYTCDLAVIPDSGENFTIITDEKGAFHFAVEFRGKPAHGSMPWLGDSAIEKVLKFYEDLKNFILYESDDPEHWHNTVVMGTFKGGNKVNQIPPYARAEFDLRFVSPFTLDEIKYGVSYLVKKYGGKMEVLSEGHPFSTDINNPLVKTFIDSVREVIGDTKFGKTHGATDGRFFAAKDIPVVMIYPEGGDIHGDDEWVSFDSLVKLYKIFEDFVGKI